jgi:Ca-activated chloride channel family protein
VGAVRLFVAVAVAGAASCERTKDNPPPPPPPPRTVPVDVAIAIDVSHSMMETDLAPDRLGAASAAFRRFVAADQRDRFAVVEFAQRPVVVVPLVRGDAVVEALAKLRVGDVPELGTAMGDGLALAIDQLGASKVGHRAIVLCSDGDSNWVKRFDPDQAAAQAKALGIPVYAVMVGVESTGAFGPSVEPEILSRIAAATGGKFYKAPDAASFDRAFADIRKKADALAAAP